MKSINKFTIPCTEEQTRKALELGAPLFRLYGTGCSDYTDMIVISDTEAYIIPTAEEMIGWIETQGIFIHIDYSFEHHDYIGEMCLLDGLTQYSGNHSTRKGAILAAIDAALDYLENNRK